MPPQRSKWQFIDYPAMSWTIEEVNMASTLYRRREYLVVVEAPAQKAGLWPGTAPYWVSGSLGFITAMAAAITFFVPGVLRGPAVMNGSARGTALVLLVVAVPALALSMLVAATGSARAVIAWLGATAYIAYNSVLFLFATPFNSIFLLYVATLSLSMGSIAAVLHAMDVPSFAERYSRKLPARAIAAYLLVIVGLNSLAWLWQVVPGMLSTATPQFMNGTGLPTNPVFVQDLAIWLPLMGVSAVWLWRRAAWGYVLSGLLLVMYVIEGLGVAADQWFGSTADPTSSVASAAAVPMFLVLAVVGLVPLFFHMENLDREAMVSDR
jgi:hypothetical protein